MRMGMGAMDVGHGGHQNPIGMMAHSAGGISPDIRRRVTRGMGMGMPDEGYSMLYERYSYVFFPTFMYS